MLHQSVATINVQFELIKKFERLEKSLQENTNKLERLIRLNNQMIKQLKNKH